MHAADTNRYRRHVRFAHCACDGPRFGRPAGPRRPTAFLDRDGVLNVDFGYVRHVRDWQWMHGARAGIEWLKAQGYWVIVVTNQSAIARGLATEPQVLALHDWVLAHARVDAIYHCRHLPHDPCPARKPQPGMLQAAGQDFAIDWGRSFLVGDRDTDIEAAQNANIPGLLSAGDDWRGLVRDYVSRRTS